MTNSARVTWAYLGSCNGLGVVVGCLSHSPASRYHETGGGREQQLLCCEREIPRKSSEFVEPTGEGGGRSANKSHAWSS